MGDGVLSWASSSLHVPGSMRRTCWGEKKDEEAGRAKHELVALIWTLPCCIVGSFLVLQGQLCYPQSGHIQPAWVLLPPSPHPDGRGFVLPARFLPRLQRSGGKLGDQDESHLRARGPPVSAAP